MREWKKMAGTAAGMFFLFTILCGIGYTLLVTGLAQLLFPRQANGSIIEIEGKQYGSALLGQYFTGEEYLWGRIMQLELTTFQKEDGEPLLYAVPSNLSPAGGEFEKLVEERVERLRAAHPDQADTPIPVDLVTGSGSGLDPHISPAAAQYQVGRIAAARNLTQEQVREVIARCTEGRLWGILGEETVHVLKVNLMLDEILKPM